MELRNSYMVIIGVLIVIALMVLWIVISVSKQKYKAGVKAANLDLLVNDPYYKRKKLEYRLIRILLWTSIAGVIVCSSYICARPYYVRQTLEEKYSRDIIICMDVSTSVNDLNLKLTKELQNTVKQLKGERVGIVMFNTSPVLLSPLTDDYEYTCEQLQNINTAIKATDSKFGLLADDWLYWNNFLFSGTLVGNEERGSSLIGDGLLGAVFNFSKYDKHRTKIVIFATDNDPYGEPYASLTEAAQICKKNDIVVYGIGTKSMYNSNMEEMKAAMELTGGKFYLEENALTFKNIVDDIESQSADLIKGKIVIKEIETPQYAYYLLCIFAVCSLLLIILSKQVDIPWAIRQVIAIALVVALFVMYVNPAMYHVYGDDTEIKVKSDLNILFVVDSTISMLAQDYDGEEERLTGVKEDCSKIIDELSGARFSVITFANEAKQLTPFTSNGEHIKNTIYSVYPLGSLYARGTNMNVTKDVILQAIKYGSTDENQKTAVFFISDGEVTTDNMLEPYEELAPYISGGAVLGYGTDKGGKMYLQDPYMDEPEVVMDRTDYPYSEAISRIDEKNLKRIASDLGVSYLNMNETNNLGTILNSLKSDINATYEVIENESDDKEDSQTFRFENDWWLLALGVLGLYSYEAIRLAKKK